MSNQLAIIAGAHGIVGGALARHLAKASDWNVVTVSRRAESAVQGARHLSLDLLDSDACDTAFRELPEATHVFYCAYAQRASHAEDVKPNLQMLVNLVSAVEKHAPRLERVVLVHGTKWYGNHLGPFRTPAREDDPRHFPPNFYYDQQDWIVNAQRGKRWSWTAFRPHGIYGYAKGSPMNHLMALSLYASISRHVGGTLKFPGSPAAFAALNQYTDARLLARAMAWSVSVQACENQAFNINNGEPERWLNIWPSIASCFGMQEGDVQQLRLASVMPSLEQVWESICDQHGLERNRLTDYVDWNFADWVYSNGFDQISSLEKIRKAGWDEFLRYEDMLETLVADLRHRRLIPS